MFSGYALAALFKVSSAQTEANCLEALAAVAAELGADHAAFALSIRVPGLLEELHLATTGDQAWTVRYQQGAHHLHDAWLRYCATNTSPAVDTAIQPISEREQETRELAAAHGITSALIVPAPASAGVSRFGMLLLGAGKRFQFNNPASSKVYPFARALAMQLHEDWVARMRGEFIARRRVTTGELQLVGMERDGYATKEICALTGASPASVNSRFQRINEKFGVSSRSAAASLAVALGLIDPAPPWAWPGARKSVCPTGESSREVATNTAHDGSYSALQIMRPSTTT